MTIDDLEVGLHLCAAGGARRRARRPNDKATQDPEYFCTADANCDMIAGETCNTATHECVGCGCNVDGDCPVCQNCDTINSICVLPVMARYV